MADFGVKAYLNGFINEDAYPIVPMPTVTPSLFLDSAGNFRLEINGNVAAVPGGFGGVGFTGVGYIDPGEAGGNVGEVGGYINDTFIPDSPQVLGFGHLGQIVSPILPDKLNWLTNWSVDFSTLLSTPSEDDEGDGIVTAHCGEGRYAGDVGDGGCEERTFLTAEGTPITPETLAMGASFTAGLQYILGNHVFEAVGGVTLPIGAFSSEGFDFGGFSSATGIVSVGYTYYFK